MFSTSIAAQLAPFVLPLTVAVAATVRIESYRRIDTPEALAIRTAAAERAVGAAGSAAALFLAIV